MSASEWSGDDLVAALVAPVEPPFAGELAIVTEPPTAATTRADLRRAVERLATLPTVIAAGPDVALGVVAELVDLAVADSDDLAALVAAVGRSPLAAQSLAVLLRGGEGRSVSDGLAAESAVFSTLQAGPEHRDWIDARQRHPRLDDGVARVRVGRDGDVLRVTLARPAARNALDVRMRDELLEALSIAEADSSLRVEMRGEGAMFCAGGDLDAFGSAPDPAAAHLIRLRRSVGAVLHRLERRATAFVHGACAGSGVELPAFCGRVVARPDATFVLPEVSLGLVPGAGGTVSLPRRIGRHRTAWLALTGCPIDAETARSWNLVDEIGLF